MKLDKRLKKITKDEEQISELAKVSGGRIIDFLENNVRKVLAGSNADKLANSAGLLEKIKKGGFAKAISGTDDLYAKALEQVESSLPKKFSFTKANKQQLQQLVEFQQQGLTKFLSGEVDLVRNSIAATVLLGREPDIDAIARELEPRLARYVETELETELASFHRSATLIAAKQAGLKRFLYYGNLEKDSRPFCKAHAGNIYTLAQLENMDNGQGLPVIPYLGGYNCRHRLVAMDDEEDAQEGETG